VDFSIRSEYGIVYAIAAVVVAAIVAYYYYRKSSATGKLKWILPALRFLSLLFILLLFMSPVLSFLGKSGKKPLNIILIDESRSMNTGNEDKMREQIIASGKNSGNSRFFLFSDGLIKEINEADAQKINFDTAGINNNKTNLSKTLSELKENLPGENISSVTIISDGILNDGGNPVQSGIVIGAPVNFFLTGDTAGTKDVSITKVFYNKTSFIESSVPLSAEVKTYGISGMVKVKLYEDGRLADTKELLVEQNKNVYNVDFTVSSPEQRTVLYRIEADSIDGEVTLKNNFREFFVKFIDNRFRILVLAGAPSADLAFVKEQMKKIRNFDAEFRTQKAQGEFYEGALPDVSDFDAVILFGYPTAISDDRIISEINNAVEKINMPLIFFTSRNTDFSKLNDLADKLPFSVQSPSSQNEEETSLNIVAGTTAEFFKDRKFVSAINGLPSIFKNSTVFSAKPNAQTLIVTGRGSNPALIVSRSTDRNSAAFLAYGIYKWRLGENPASAEEVLGYLLANIVSSVAKKDEGRKFLVETTSPVYSKNEDVIFNGSITGFEIKGGEQIKINISGPSFQTSFDMTKRSSKDFQLLAKMPMEGVYSYEAALISEGRQVETVTGKFLVGENNFEYLQTTPDPMLLNELASATGGRRLNGLNDGEIRNLYEESGRSASNEVVSSRSFDLNINPYYLSIIILLLSVEWFLRKRNNLP